jgi:ubiquinone/menaquinone biosynthesis C-methylase UbiE
MLRSLYDRFLLPHIIHRVCRVGMAEEQRRLLVPLAAGNVLEIGIGSGHNLPFYDTDQVDHILGIDPAEELWALRENPLPSVPFEYTPASAENIPAENDIFDTVLITYTMCSIPDLPRALQEIKRVLKPSGRLLFCEHGKAPDSRVAFWQEHITPVWKQFGGGCHLNRDIPRLLVENGFHIMELDTRYFPGWKPATYNFRGIATIR